MEKLAETKIERGKYLEFEYTDIFINTLKTHHKKKIKCSLESIRIEEKHERKSSENKIQTENLQAPKSIMNFTNLVIYLSSLASIIMSPMVVYIGVRALGYGLTVIVADKALMTLGVMIFILGILQIISTFYKNETFLLFCIYSNLILVVYTIMFSLGCITFTPDVQEWIYNNWDVIRNQASEFNLNDFRQSFENNILSLGTFALSISLGLIINIGSTIYILGGDKFLKSFPSAFALIFIAFSTSALFFPTQARDDLTYIQMPLWAVDLLIFASIALTIIAILAYISSLKENIRMLRIYLICLTIMSLVLLACGVGFLVLALRVEEIVLKDWEKLKVELFEKGVVVDPEIFIERLNMNLKFAGLYVLAFFIFIFIGVLVSFFKLFKFSKD